MPPIRGVGFLGRTSECEHLDGVLAQARDGRSAVLVVRGEPGVGKTALLRYAARQGAVAVNPVREVGRIDSPPRRQPRALTAEERQAWIDVVKSSKKAQDWDLPDLTRMMLATGCRIGCVKRA